MWHGNNDNEKDTHRPPSWLGGISSMFGNVFRANDDMDVVADGRETRTEVKQSATLSDVPRSDRQTVVSEEPVDVLNIERSSENDKLESNSPPSQAVNRCMSCGEGSESNAMGKSKVSQNDNDIKDDVSRQEPMQLVREESTKSTGIQEAVATDALNPDNTLEPQMQTTIQADEPVEERTVSDASFYAFQAIESADNAEKLREVVASSVVALDIANELQPAGDPSKTNKQSCNNVTASMQEQDKRLECTVNNDSSVVSTNYIGQDSQILPQRAPDSSNLRTAVMQAVTEKKSERKWIDAGTRSVARKTATKFAAPKSRTSRDRMPKSKHPLPRNPNPVPMAATKLRHVLVTKRKLSKQENAIAEVSQPSRRGRKRQPPPMLTTVKPQKKSEPVAIFPAPIQNQITDVQKTLLLQLMEVEVNRAAEAISDALLSGPWPSPFRSLEPAAIANRTEQDYVSHFQKMTVVGESLKRFAKDVVLPTFQAEIVGPTSPSRIFLAALLFIREVLIQNSEAIFGLSALVPGREPDYAALKRPVQAFDQLQANDRVAALFSVKVLVAGIVLVGIDSRSEMIIDSNIGNTFLDLCDSYDRGDADFAAFLGLATTEEGKSPPANESSSKNEGNRWNVGFNMLRANHPIVIEDELRKKGHYDGSSALRKVKALAPTNATYLMTSDI